MHATWSTFEQCGTVVCARLASYGTIVVFVSSWIDMALLGCGGANKFAL